MSTLTNNNIAIDNTPLRVVLADGRAAPRQESPILSEKRPTSALIGVSLAQHHADFSKVVGPDPQHALLLSSAESSRNPFFHAGCAYVIEPSATASSPNGGSGDDQPQEALYVTSNLLQANTSSQLPVILISRVGLRRNAAGDVTSAEWAKLRPPSTMPMPAGAIPYSRTASGQRTPSPVPGGNGNGMVRAGSNGSNGASSANDSGGSINTGNGSSSGSGSGHGTSSGVVYCAQGNPNPGSSGLFYMPRGQPPQPLVTSYYGRDFNSVHDVTQAADGSLWFTDPCHGFEQDFRKKPQLPCHVYRFNPESAELRVVADGLGRPTGICFSPDGKTLYITDTDAVHGDGNQDSTLAATIYAFDVLWRAGSPFLANKRTFAFSLRGVPIGVKCDLAGNVYAGCADGVEVWNAGGTLLGVIEVPGGVSNFCFSRDGEMFLCSEQRLWWVHFKPKRIEVSRWGTVPAALPISTSPEGNFI